MSTRIITNPIDEGHSIIRLLSSERAIDILERYLGNSRRYWKGIVKARSADRSEDEHLAFWSVIEDLRDWCDERDVYQIVAITAPDVLTSDSSGTPFGDPFSCSARLDVAFEDGCTLRVYLDHNHVDSRKPLLRAGHARQLAMELLKIADICETHRYDPRTKRLVSIVPAHEAEVKENSPCQTTKIFNW